MDLLELNTNLNHIQDMEIGQFGNSEVSEIARSTPLVTPNKSAGGGDTGPSKPNYKLRGEQEEFFRTLRKLLYKCHLPQHYESEIRKGIRDNRPLIRVQKSD